MMLKKQIFNGNNMHYHKHFLYVDAMRVLAIFAVVLLHVAAQAYTKYDVGTTTWNIGLFWNSLSRWGVPIFVMISGILFLQPSKKFSIKIIYSKYIKRILVLIISWSFIYALYRLLTEDVEFNLIKFISICVSGYYHLWFLYMIIGLYAIIPFLKKIADNRTYITYFIVLSLVFSFIIPTIYLIVDGITAITGSEKLTTQVNLLFDRFKFSFTLNYVSYYVLGYYLTIVDVSPMRRFIIYLLGTLGLAFTFGYSYFISTKLGTPWNAFSNLSLNVLFESLSVFLLLKLVFTKQNSIAHLMNVLSKYSLGIYLIHPMIIDFLGRQQWYNTFYQSSFLAIPLLAICVFVLSLFCTIILDKSFIFRRIIS